MLMAERSNEGRKRIGGSRTKVISGAVRMESRLRQVTNAYYLTHNLAEVPAKRDAQTQRKDGRGCVVFIIP